MWRRQQETERQLSTLTNNLIVNHKDADTGEPTGAINEQTIQLVERRIPQASAEDYADFIVLDQDLFDVETTDIYGTNVLTTVLDEKVVYEGRSHGYVEVEGLDTNPVGKSH